MLGVLGLTLAMIGSGVWSVDAVLYGRQHIAFSPALAFDASEVVVQNRWFQLVLCPTIAWFGRWRDQSTISIGKREVSRIHFEDK